jgi:hypothetical protein
VKLTTHLHLVPRSGMLELYVIKHRENYLNRYNILNKLRNYIFQVLNVHGVNGVRQTEMHLPETVSEAYCF